LCQKNIYNGAEHDLLAKTAKRKVKTKAARIAKQLKKHEEAKERRERMRLFRQIRKNQAAGRK
jgi:hypothetical protein